MSSVGSSNGLKPPSTQLRNFRVNENFSADINLKLFGCDQKVLEPLNNAKD